MSDIVERLRLSVTKGHEPTDEDVIDAADEIERLRAENDLLSKVITSSQDKIDQLSNEVHHLRAALADMIEITKRNSEAGLMLLAIRTCAQHALADQGKG